MSANKYANLVQTGMEHVLAPLGYHRRRKSTFVAQKADVLHIINFQKSDKSTREVLIFTINLGVFSLFLARREGEPVTEDVWSCHWRERIGFLLPENDDKWWMVDNPTDAETTAKKIGELLLASVIPTLEQLDSTDKLVGLWKQGRSPGLTKAQRERYLKQLGHPN